MISYQKYTLKNGLRLLVHRDETTTVAAVNILYNAGARDEDPSRTGFAHLFEHLMFGGSVHIPDFDGPLQQAGGENNAFTTNDLTNYYLTIPQNNLETALWLESDRMLNLAFTEKSLDVQRQVVVEEFRQRYLNQPYGDLWLLLRPLAYQVHPYRWATIGMDISHIQQATMEEVHRFYETFYHPGNAIISVVSGLEEDHIARLVEKWFGDIPGKDYHVRALPKEPVQTEARTLTVNKPVPFDVITIAYPMAARRDPDYYAHDLISDLLSSGKSSRMYEDLIRNKRTFTDISAYITGDDDPGLFIIYGKLSPDTSKEVAEAQIMAHLDGLSNEVPETREFQKAIHRIESVRAFSDVTSLNRAYKLAWAEWMGDLSLVNDEMDHYHRLNPEKISEAAKRLFRPENASTLYYLSSEKPNV